MAQLARRLPTDFACWFRRAADSALLDQCVAARQLDFLPGAALHALRPEPWFVLVEHLFAVLRACMVTAITELNKCSQAPI